MFHASELEARNYHKIVLAERQRNAGKILHIGDRIPHLFENIGELGKFFRVSLPVIRRHFPSGCIRSDRLPLSCGKREKIGRNHLGRLEYDHAAFSLLLGCIGNGLPALRNIQRQLKYSLQIGLVEARENRTGMGRHEKSIEVLLVSVEKAVFRNKIHFHAVLSPFQKL